MSFVSIPLSIIVYIAMLAKMQLHVLWQCLENLSANLLKASPITDSKPGQGI